MKKRNKDELLKFWLKSEICSMQAFMMLIFIVLASNVFISVVGAIFIAWSILKSIIYISFVASQDPDYLRIIE